MNTDMGTIKINKHALWSKLCERWNLSTAQRNKTQHGGPPVVFVHIIDTFTFVFVFCHE